MTHRSPLAVRSPKGLIEVAVLVHGHPLRVHYRLDGRPYVAGVPGEPYVLSVRNLTQGRMEVLATVDGRNVLQDEQASLTKSHGLIIAPRTHHHGSGVYDFAGFRFDDSEVGEFVFGTPETSVAAQAGDSSSVGVFGFAAWTEQLRFPDSGSGYRSGGYESFGGGGGSKGVSFASASASNSTFGGGEVTRGMALDSAEVPQLGTGIGDRRHDPVGRTSFDRSSGEPDVIAVGYNTEAELLRLGVIRPADPDPFPASSRTGYDRYASVTG